MQWNLHDCGIGYFTVNVLLIAIDKRVARLSLSEAVLQHETVLERMHGRVWQRETNSVVRVYTKHIR